MPDDLPTHSKPISSRLIYLVNMTDKKSILVLGAGELGTAVLDALATHPQRGSNSITVLLRPTSISSSDSTKQAQISTFRSLGIDNLAGDITNTTEADLASLFSPFDTVIGCAGMTYPPGTQLKLTRAILAAQTRRYFPWQFGVDYDVIGRGSSQDLFSEQLDVRDLLRQQTRTDWVIVSTGLFMSFLFNPVFGVVSADRKRVTALGGWQNRVTVTVAKDIGRVVAELVLAAPEVKGVVFTAGETLSFGQVADVVGRVSGGEVEREERSVEELKEELAEDPKNGIIKYRVVFAEGKGVAWDEEGTFNVTRGMKLQGVEEWARENLK